VRQVVNQFGHGAEAGKTGVSRAGTGGHRAPFKDNYPQVRIFFPQVNGRCETYNAAADYSYINVTEERVFFPVAEFVLHNFGVLW
jgi:hypothetical protein